MGWGVCDKMQKRYVKIKRIYNAISLVEKKHQVLFMSAQAGFGKTAALRYYYRRKAVLYLSGQKGYLDAMPDMNSIQEPTIVIDDISWIDDDKSEKYVCELVRQAPQQIILSGRSGVPAWLKRESIEQHFMILDRNDFLLSMDEVRQLLESYGVLADEQTLRIVYKEMLGYALGTSMIAQHLAKGETLDDALLEAANVDCYHYLDSHMYERWNPDMRKLLLIMAEFPEFDIKMAELVSGRHDAAALIEQAMTVGSFLALNRDGRYELQLMLRNYLMWKRDSVLDDEEQREIFNRAGHYYEQREQIENALFYYDRAENEKKVSRLLIRNAEKQPGMAHFFETREYYLKLPEEMILESPTLIAGMSMIHSHLLHVEESNAWYDRLVAFEKELSRNDPRKKESWGRIAYLQIALPQTGSLKISTILKDVAILCVNNNVHMPEFSVTSNLPSTMNGGKDFCEWSKRDRELAATLKRPMEIMFGKFGAGLVNTALGESLFEKGAADGYEVLTMLNSGYQMAETKGRIEMCFAAVGILARFYVSRNQLDMAISQLDNFDMKVDQEEAWQLKDNIHTMYTWFHLLTGDKLYV